MINEFVTFLEQDSSILFLAPTGWGKTTLLLELSEKTNKSIVYFAPLRALANEFYLRALQYGIRSFAPKTMKELNQIISGGIEFKLLILTPELVNEKAIESLDDKIAVFDEFHLFYYWGRDFRPKLMELYEIVSNNSLPALLLTATASEEVIEFWKESTKLQENKFLFDVGNQKIKKEPQHFFHVNQNLAYKHIDLALHGVKLVFCKYRAQAKGLAAEYKNKGFNTLSCVSGEVEEFQREMAQMEKIDFIFCTSTLSHGVNLPEISCLYILYKVNNLDLWLQMAGRAGRRGEEFILVSADRGNRSRSRSFVSLFKFMWHYVFERTSRIFDAIRRDYCP